MFEFARLDVTSPFWKEGFEVLEREYVKTGKLGGIALSEPNAEMIHEAVKYATIVAVEVELSM